MCVKYRRRSAKEQQDFDDKWQSLSDILDTLMLGFKGSLEEKDGD